MISLKRMMSALALAAAALLAGPATAQQSLNLTPLSIEALAQNAAITGLTISPDGRHMAGLVGSPDHRWPVVAIWSIENLSAPPVWIPSTEMRPRQVFFLGNEHVMFLVDQPFTSGATKRFTIEAIVTDLRGRNFSQPLGGGVGGGRSNTERNAGANFSVLLAGSLQDPDRWLVSKVDNDTFASEVVAINVNTLRTERVARAGDDENFILADIRDGQLMVKESLKFANGVWNLVREVRNRQSGGWEEHPELGYPVRERWTLQPLGFFDPDPNKLYVATNRGENFAEIRIYDIVTRQWSAEPAFASPQYDITSVSPSVNEDTDQVLGPESYTLAGPAIREVYVDDVRAPVQQMLEAQFRGQNVDINFARFRPGYAVVTVSGPSAPPAYYLLENGTQLRMVGRSRPWIDNATLGTTTFVNYAARDGLNIPAFLTLPPGYNKDVHGRIPVIVLPHGGPWSRDDLGWDMSGWPQFLATRGYAVIQPQYRGSDGWGMALWRAGDQEWGQKMQDDNDDAAAWLVAQGIGDQDRLGIFGYSYGGFAAIAASVRPNSPYQCALAGAGVSDLQRLGNLWGANRIQREVQGWTVEGMNPIQHVRDANIPILLYHGDHDRQADTVHSRDFYRAMRGAGKQVEYYEIETMWHQLPWYPEWHRESLGYIESWFAGPNCFGSQQASN